MMKTSFAQTVILAGLISTLCFKSHGAAGDVDLSFFPGAALGGPVRATALQSDGKVIIGGEVGIARLNADGGSDPGFQRNSAIVVGGNALILQPDGKVLAAHQGGVVRLNANGSADTNFTATIDFTENSAVYAIAMQPNGKVLMGGSFTLINDTYRPGIARLNTDASLDSGFAPVVSGTVFAVAVQSDGKVLIGGRITTPAGDRCLLRLHADGTLDESFDSGLSPDGVVISLVIQNDGKIVAGGFFSVGTHRNIVRLNANGDADPTFQTGAAADNTVFSIQLQSDGKMLVAGGFTEVNGTSRNALARLNLSGSLDESFNPGTNFPGAVVIESLLVQPDGKVLMAGSFTEIGGITREGFARINGGGSLDVAFNPGGGINRAVDFLLVQPDGKVLISGDFTSVNGASRNGIARLNYDGSLDATVFERGSAGSFGRVTAVALQADGRVLIGSQDGLARAHANGTLDSSFVAEIGTGDDRSAVTSIAVQTDGKILVGGYGSTEVVDPIEGGITVWYRFHLTRLNADGSYDTTFERTLGESLPNDRYFVEALALQPDGKVLVAGYFFTFKGTNHAGIARVNSDGTLDTGFNVGANHSVAALGLQPDGKVLIGGAFTLVNGTSRRRVARLHADGSLDSSFNPGTGADSAIRAIALQSNGKLLVAGVFNTINGTNRQRIARLNVDGTLDDRFIAFPEPDYVHSLALQTDGKILMGGSFSLVNGVASPHVARLMGDSPAPSLSVVRSNQFIIVSWALTSGYVLDQSLTTTGVWSHVAFPYVTNGNNVSVSTSPLTDRRFYRLRKP